MQAFSLQTAAFLVPADISAEVAAHWVHENYAHINARVIVGASGVEWLSLESLTVGVSLNSAASDLQAAADLLRRRTAARG